MTRCLALISLLALALACPAQSILVPANSSRKYAVAIAFRQASLSGICVVRDREKDVAGSVVNEFGIKAFDFVYDKQKRKLKVRNVIKALDKWYIRRVVNADLGVLFREKNSKRQLRHRRIYHEGDSVVALENTKRGIRYKFKTIDDTQRQLLLH